GPMHAAVHAAHPAATQLGLDEVLANFLGRRFITLLSVGGLDGFHLRFQDGAIRLDHFRQEILDAHGLRGLQRAFEAIADFVDLEQALKRKVVPGRGTHPAPSRSQTRTITCNLRSKVRRAQPSRTAISGGDSPCIFASAIGRRSASPVASSSASSRSSWSATSAANSGVGSRLINSSNARRASAPRPLAPFPRPPRSTHLCAVIATSSDHRLLRSASSENRPS